MKNIDFNDLYNIANTLANEKQLNDKTYIGRVAVALLTSNNNIYTGVCLKTTCALSFCAETAAIANMLTNNESHIIKLVAVYEGGQIISPCGHCRELIYQINHNNIECEILLENNRIVTLENLLPEL